MRASKQMLTALATLLLAAVAMLSCHPVVKAQQETMSASAEKYKACFDKCAQAVAPCTGVDAVIMDPKVAEHLAGMYTDALIEMFCTTVRSGGCGGCAQRAVGGATAAPASHQTQLTKKRRRAKTGIVRAAAADDDSDFATPYEVDRTRASLYKPHEAEYFEGNYSSSFNTLKLGGIVSGGDYKNRPSSGGQARTLIAERVFAIVAPITKAGCDLLDCQPDDITPLCIPNPGSLIPKACYIAYEVLLFAQQVSQIDKEAIDWVITNIDSVQLQATHENTKKYMENQQILFEYTQQRYNQLKGSLNDAFTRLSKRECKLQSDVAYLQREFNYLRRLLLAPTNSTTTSTTRPGWSCYSQSLTANPFPKAATSEPCTLSAPLGGCTLATVQYTTPWTAPTTQVKWCTTK